MKEGQRSQSEDIEEISGIYIHTSIYRELIADTFVYSETKPRDHSVKDCSPGNQELGEGCFMAMGSDKECRLAQGKASSDPDVRRIVTNLYHVPSSFGDGGSRICGGCLVRFGPLGFSISRPFSH